MRDLAIAQRLLWSRAVAAAAGLLAATPSQAQGNDDAALAKATQNPMGCE